MPKLWESLFAISPYANLNVSAHAVDMQGWGSDHPILRQAIEVVRPSRIVEVGSWKGRSAINMAKQVKASGLDCEIVCVDTWLGSPEHWLKMQPEWYESLRILNGMPQLYNTFLSNVVANQVTDIITPFPSTSENAATVFQRLGVKFDIAYIDAAHEYHPVKRDLALYWDLLSEDGVLIGDDYLIWPEVTAAANDFANEKRLGIIGDVGKFLINKGKYRAQVTSKTTISQRYGSESEEWLVSVRDRQPEHIRSE